VVPPDGDPKKIGVRNYGSFEAIYAELVEPWLGSWAELRKTYARLQAGEITEEQGAEEIKLRAKLGRPTRGQEKPVHAQDIQYGTGRRGYVLARLRRDDPALLARVERGELTANAAAVEKGWRRKRTPYDELVSAWNRASDNDRSHFEDFIDQWLREQEDASCTGAGALTAA
jgi:hypothetical protein